MIKIYRNWYKYDSFTTDINYFLKYTLSIGEYFSRTKFSGFLIGCQRLRRDDIALRRPFELTETETVVPSYES